MNVIPLPARLTPREGFFPLGPNTPLAVEAADARHAAAFLRRELRLADAEGRNGGPVIRFVEAETPRGDEAYGLRITPDEIRIEARTPSGWFYAVQTLCQLVDDARVPAVEIEDAPRFRWRGLMLDVSRHLFPVDDLLRLLDCMAMHKLNSFHWHLTDDQGWRVESKRFPRLTEVGAFRQRGDGSLIPGDTTDAWPDVPGTYGGFYTHDDVRRVVAHAAALHIRVVPEIEMPGHATAALAAYPELACVPRDDFAPAVRTGVFPDVYCAGNDATLALLEGVLDELLPLFPGAYVHVGGDECPKDRWRTCPKCQARIKAEGLKDEHELQSYVIRRMDRFLAERGKRLIGWDEILEGGLAPGATVMSWRGTAGGVTAARAGRDVVMSPRRPCYLDYRQAAAGEPYAIGQAVNTLEDAYAFEPVPAELTAEQARHVLGLQGNVWTEYMPDMGHVEYMVWPRAAALAEVGWSPAASRDLADFRRRAVANEGRLAARGSRFRPIG